MAGFPEGDEPEPWAYAARNWGLLCHIAADPAQVTSTVIAGEGGDELLLGQVFAVADRHARGDIDGAAHLPPELLRDNGFEKVVLREALSDLLPASVAQRRDKAEALALMHTGLGESVETIRAVAQGGPLADHGVIKPDKLRLSIDGYLAGQHDLGPALWASQAMSPLSTRPVISSSSNATDHAPKRT